MTEKMRNQASNLFGESMKNYEEGIRTGLKIQEEGAKWWTNFLNQATSAQEWQRRVTSLAGDWMPSSQKMMEESMKLVEQNSRAGADLLKKAMDATQTSNFAESQAKWGEVWESSFKSLRSNAQAIAQMQQRATDTWIDWMRRSGEAAGMKPGKGAA